jgi:CSLREA domain-containing protein
MPGKGPPTRQATRQATKPTTLVARVLLAAMVGVVAALSFVAYAPHAHALGTLIRVDTAQDESNADKDCSLREAIQAADTNQAVDGCAAGSSVSRDTIVFSLGSSATIRLRCELAASEEGLLPATTDSAGLLIDGGSASITVSGSDCTGPAVFSPVSRGAKLKLKNLTVADGWLGIANFGTLWVTNSTFSQNGSSFLDGAISNEGTLRVTNSTFSQNGSSHGAGAISNGGMLWVTDSTFSHNGTGVFAIGGGAISNSGTIKVTNSTFSGNNAGTSGGGIYNQHGGTLRVTDSTFSQNIAENEPGGAIYNAGTLRVRYSTFSQNSAGGSSEMVPIEGGGAIANDGSGTASLSDTIVARNTAASGGENCSGTVTDDGYNIEDGTSCRFRAANHSLPSTNPKLASSLANNGGPTLTIALLTGSPAINAIPKARNGCGTKITTDQRGVKRPQGNRCDIGAFEKKQ